MDGTRPQAPARLAPDGAFTLPLTVRSYEANEWGTVSPSTLLRYLEHLATQASRERGFGHTWYARQGTAWVVREMALELHALPGIDDELAMATWLSEYRRVQAFREYVIWRHDGGQTVTVARAQARWAYVDRLRGHLVRIPEEIVTRLGTAGHALRPLNRLGAHTASDDSPTTMTLTARRYEMDSQLHVNNCVYLDWLEEALRDAIAPSVTTLMLPRAYHIEYVSQTRAGDHISIETRWHAPSARGVLAAQRIANQAGETLVRARSLYLRCPPHAAP